MTLREFYENSGMDYDAFLRRLMGKESLAKKYTKIFLADNTYAELAQMFAEKNVEQICKKAHTLKGIALNLDLKKLSDLCVEMMDIGRAGNMQAMEESFGRLKAEYDYLVSALGECTADWEIRP